MIGSQQSTHFASSRFVEPSRDGHHLGKATKDGGDLDDALHELTFGAGKRRSNRLLAAGGALTLLFLAMTFNVYYERIDGGQRAQAQQEAALVEQGERIEQLESQLTERSRELDERSRQIAALNSELVSTVERADKASLGCELFDAEAERNTRKADGKSTPVADEPAAKTAPVAARAEPKAAPVAQVDARAMPVAAKPAIAERSARKVTTVAQRSRSARDGRSTGVGPAKLASKSGKCACAQGDPLCGCLQ